MLLLTARLQTFTAVQEQCGAVTLCMCDLWHVDHVQDRFQHALQTYVHPEMPLDQGVIAALHSAKVTQRPVIQVLHQSRPMPLHSRH